MAHIEVYVYGAAGSYCAQWLNFTLPYSLYRISRKSDMKQFFLIMHLIQQQKIECICSDRYIDHICSKKERVYFLIFRITCVYYIIRDNRDLQSCHIGQGNDVAIPTPDQSTFRTLGHQAVPRLASSLDWMWHTFTRGFWSKKDSLISVCVQIARQCVEWSTRNVPPRVTTSWSLNNLCLNKISMLFDRTTRQWNSCFLCPSCQLAPPKWAIKKDLVRCTWSEHLNVKMVSKIKITAHRQKIRLSVIGNTRWVNTVTF